MGRFSMFVVTSVLACAAADGTVSSFVSNDGSYCAEGPSRAAESALAVLKASPVGGLFNMSACNTGSGCAERGFTYGTATDPCVPSVKRSFLSAGGESSFAALQRGATASFGARYGLSVATATTMAACTCMPGSQLATTSCDETKLAGYQGSWVHQNPYNHSHMICDQGPFTYATRALQVLKASPQLAMHYRDQIAPVNCSVLGFPVIYDVPDHCYPLLRVHTATGPIQDDPGVMQAIAIEHNLTANNAAGFFAWAKTMAKPSMDAGSVSIVNNSLACNCLDSSSVGQQVHLQCWTGKPTDEGHSPVRDWWSGDV